MRNRCDVATRSRRSAVAAAACERQNVSAGVQTTEVAVIGGGPAGLVCAIALAATGAETVLIAPHAGPDHRTTALLAGSVAALETLGVWSACLPDAARLRKIRMIDDTARLLRAPEVSFAADEIGLDAFGYNIENRHLVAALEARAAALELPRVAVRRSSLRATTQASRLSMPVARCVRGSLSVRMDRGHCAVQPPASVRDGAPIRRRRSRSISNTRGRTAIFRRNFTRKAARLRWYPCPAGVPAWSVCWHRRRRRCRRHTRRGAREGY